MSSRTDLRLVTTIKGYKEFQTEMKKQIEQEPNLSSILESIDIKEKSKDIVYLGWNDLLYDDVCAIQNVTLELREKDISYRIATLGESLEDIETIEYTSKKDEKKLIPSPSIRREFDELDFKRQLKYYANSYDKEHNQEMEADE